MKPFRKAKKLINLYTFRITIYNVSGDMIFSEQHVPYAKKLGEEGGQLWEHGIPLKTLEAK